MSAKPYERGMNMAGETAGQVANFLTADLRVLLKGQPEAVDAIQDGIAKALREAAFATERAWMEAMAEDGGWSSIIERARAWMDLCRVADQAYPLWLNLPGSTGDAMKLLVKTGGEQLASGTGRRDHE